MKKLLRNYLINFAALWATTQIVPGLTYTGGIETLAIAAVILMIINILVKPMLHVLFLPLNLLTLGLFSWVINVIGLFILTMVLPKVQIVPYTFPGFSIGEIVIPATTLSTLYVAALASFVISMITNIARWLVHD